MSTLTVRTLIRLVAVLMVVAGVVGVSIALVGAFGMLVLARSMGQDLYRGSDLSSVTLYGALIWCVPIFWGAALFQLSPAIARFVTSEPEGQNSTAPKLRRGTAER